MGIYVNISDSQINASIPCYCVKYGVDMTSQGQADENYVCSDCNNTGWRKGSQYWMEHIHVSGDIGTILDKYLDTEYGAVGSVEGEELNKVLHEVELLVSLSYKVNGAKYGVHEGNWPVNIWMNHSKLRSFEMMVQVAIDKKRALHIG